MGKRTRWRWISLPFEQIVSILSIVGMVSGVAAYAVVHGLRTALGAAKEVIESLEKSYQHQKEQTEEALKEAHLARSEVLEVRQEAIESERACDEKIAALTADLVALKAEVHGIG